MPLLLHHTQTSFLDPSLLAPLSITSSATIAQPPPRPSTSAQLAGAKAAVAGTLPGALRQKLTPGRKLLSRSTCSDFLQFDFETLRTHDTIALTREDWNHQRGLTIRTSDHASSSGRGLRSAGLRLSIAAKNEVAL